MNAHHELPELPETAGTRSRTRLLAAVPLEERRRRCAGIPTAVLEGGEGPPIVLLHGQGEFGAVWMRVIPWLVGAHRVVVPDLPGHGASGVPDRRLDADAVLRWVDDLLEQTCAEPPVLVGHLLGGAIAARFAARSGDRLASLVLVDSLGLTWYRPRLRFAVPMVAFLARPTEGSRDRLFQHCFADIEELSNAASDHWDDLMAYALDRARGPSMQAALRSLMPRVGAPPIPPSDLAAIPVPTTLVHGRGDLQVPLEAAESASVRYGWPLLVVEDARDDPAFEQPDAFLAALRSALALRATEVSSPDARDRPTAADGARLP